MRFNRFMIAFPALLALMLHGCATEPTSHSTYYVNETVESSVSDDLSSELQLTVGAMINSMVLTVRSSSNMRHPPQLPAKLKPLVVIVEIDNNTEEFVDSRLVTDAIRAALRPHAALQVLDDELPLSDVRKFATQGEDVPNFDSSILYLPRLASGQITIYDHAEMQRANRISIQPAPVRVSELHTTNWLPAIENKQRVLYNYDFMFSALSQEQDVPLPTHESHGSAPVRMPVLTTAFEEEQPAESREQKRERIFRFLEKRLKEQREGVQDYAPVYVIRTVLLPFAIRPPNIKSTKEPYMFKMFVEDIQSGTIKWASAWEVRNNPLISFNFINNNMSGSYHTSAPTELGQDGYQDPTLSDDDLNILDDTATVRSIGAIRESIQN